MKSQKIENKLGEVKFRKKISSQQSKNKKFFKNERKFGETVLELRRRVKRTSQDFKRLKRAGINFTTYLEIGAEYCPRASLLENKFACQGIATDLSLDSLSSAKNFQKFLGFKKIPQRVVCDAYNLPFPNSSVPFVFCYQTLHHFPNPKPILTEIYRILSPGGYFFFSEEPVKQWLNLPLWRRPTVLRPWEKALKYIGVLPFISRIGKTEVDHGILEEVFPLTTWEKALNVFDSVQTITKPYPFGPQSQNSKSKSNWLHPKLSTKFLMLAWGGGIEAICKKEGSLLKNPPGNILNSLNCPNCLSRKKISAKLQLEKTGAFCPKCKRDYPKKAGILILLRDREMRKLYGEKANA